jgi:hypothetical protein
MRARARSLRVVAIAVVLLGIGAQSAAAATLFTRDDHVAHVPLGATATLKSTTTLITSASTTTLTDCTGSTQFLNTGALLRFVLQQNSGGEIAGTVTGGSFTDCAPLPVTPTFTTTWRLTVSGGPTANGENTEWAATLSNMKFDFMSTAFSQSMATVKMSETRTAIFHRLCLALEHVGGFQPFPTSIYVDGRFCFDLDKSGWSLG